MKSRRALPIVALVLLPFVAYCDDQTQDEKILNQYVRPGLMLSAERILPTYPSERDVAIGIAKQSMQWLDLSTLQQYPFFEDSRIGRPIPVRILARYYTHKASFDRYYYYFVPLVHLDIGLAAILLYEKDEGLFTHKVSFEFAGIHPIGNPKRPIYLMDGEEARHLSESTFSIRIDTKPFAVWTGLGSYPNNLDGWFWYMRCSSGLLVDGKAVYSFFVNPYAFVPDIHAVTQDVLLDPRYSQGGSAFITQRFYTLETDEDYYALSDAEIKGKSNQAIAQLYGRAAERTIVPETIRPLLLDSQGHVSLGLINNGR